MTKKTEPVAQVEKTTSVPVAKTSESAPSGLVRTDGQGLVLNDDSVVDPKNVKWVEKK